jgi:hypothetical protein
MLKTAAAAATTTTTKTHFFYSILSDELRDQIMPIHDDDDYGSS